MSGMWLLFLVHLSFETEDCFADASKALKTSGATSSATRVAEVPTVKKKEVDSDCVKRQLESVYDFEKVFFNAHQKYSDDLKAAGVPQSVIDDCPGWSDPAARTSYGGMGFTVRSENKETGEAWSLNNEKSYIQESPGHGKGR